MGAVLQIPRNILGSYHYLLCSNSSQVDDPDDHYAPCSVSHAFTFNSNYLLRMPILNDFMKALADPNSHMIGVHGSNDDIQNSLVPKLGRRIKRDKAFDVVLTANVGKKFDVKKIQDEIAGHLGFNFSKKSESERANELLDRIKKENKILIVLFDLHKGLDLGNIGIPFGEHHRGCKILVTSSCTAEKELSKLMHTQRNFFV